MASAFKPDLSQASPYLEFPAAVVAAMLGVHADKRSTFAYIDYRARGYFSGRLPPEVQGEDAPWWRTVYDAVEHLTKGDFDHRERLLEVALDGPPSAVQHVACQILGDCGSWTQFQEIRRRLEATPASIETRDYKQSLNDAVAQWSRLDAVPFLLSQFLDLRMAQVPEVDTYPLRISEIMGRSDSLISGDPPDEALEAYLNLVMDRYDALEARLGATTLCWRGELYSVRRFAEALRNVGRSRFSMVQLWILRSYFEPATGIDCTPFFQGGTPRPLAAAAMAEDFIAEHAHRFEDGKRYFFGHEVPD